MIETSLIDAFEEKRETSISSLTGDPLVRVPFSCEHHGPELRGSLELVYHKIYLVYFIRRFPKHVASVSSKYLTILVRYL